MQPIIYLFNETILFIGDIPPNDWHAIPVETIATHLAGEFSVQSHCGQQLPMTSIYWPASMERKTKYNDGEVLAYFMFPRYLNIFTKLEGSLNQVWSVNDEVRYEMVREQQWIALLKEAYRFRLDAETVKGRINDIFSDQGQNNLFDYNHCRLDPRIRQLIQLLKEEVACNREIDFSAHLGLSEQHLRRLFKETVGCSIAQYKTHLRMCLVVLLKSQGHNVTESTAGAGFYDLSHADKQHKKVYGISTAYTLSRSDVVVDEQVCLEQFLGNKVAV